MPRPRWITAAGSLGTVSELTEYTKVLEVTTDAIGSNTVDSRVTFKFLSGELPPGIQVVRTGILQGVPVITEPITVDESREYVFTIRATATDGVVVDRTFSLTITNVFPPVITPRIKLLGTLFDGAYYSRQLYAVEENPNAQLKWKLIKGQLPPGVTLNDSGLISGYVLVESDEYETNLKGYDAYDPADTSRKGYYDLAPYDSVGKSRNRNYTFTVEVTDGSNVDSLEYHISVSSKGLYTADQDHYINFAGSQTVVENWNPDRYYPRGYILNHEGVIYVTTEPVDSVDGSTPDVATNYYRVYDIQKIAITADNDYLTVDYDNRYIPVITTPAQSLPTLRQENNFAFKFDAIDFNNDDIGWTIATSDGSGFDKNALREVGFTQDTYLEFYADGDTTTVLINGVPEWTAGITYPAGVIMSYQEDLYITTSPVTASLNYTPNIDADHYDTYQSNNVAINFDSAYPDVAEFSVFGIFKPDSQDDDDQDPDIVDITEGTDYFVSTTGTQVSFDPPLPAGRYFVGLTVSMPEVDITVDSGVGFDTTVFDEGESRLPPNLSLDENGWLYGYLEPQQEESQTYDFIIKAYKKTDHTYESLPVQYQFTVLGSLTDRIIWKSPEFLGTIVNGSVSEFRVEAVSEMGQTVRYSLVNNATNRLPQALSLNLLDDGIISGRTSFRYFQLDGGDTTYDKGKTSFDLTYRFEVKAETANIKKIYKSSTTKISTVTVNETEKTDEIVYPNTIYIAYSGSTSFLGHEISGVNIAPGTVVSSQMKLIDDVTGAIYTELRLSDLLQGDIEEGDLVYILDGVVSSTKVFTMQVDPVHTEPYENLYFKAFPTLAQRQNFLDIIDDQTIFPDELIYRKSDPWFGKATTIKFLAMAGINSSSLADYISALERNHYWKQVNFGDIKTAVAVDEFYNTKYEVVYVEIVDPTNLSDATVKEQVSVTGNPYISTRGEEITTLYPSTFSNMTSNITSSLGYRARGVFPDWMTSVQPDKTVLGFRRAVVLAYTVPGAADLIAYRLKSKGVTFNDIEFTIDRYQLDNALSKNFVSGTGEFTASRATTFDRLSLGPGDSEVGVVNYAVEQPFDSINKRTVSYIRANGGIDGVKSFSDGDLLVFAKQEDYLQESGPYDGWIDYQNLYIGDIPGDGDPTEAVSGTSSDIDQIYGFDSYRVIPSIKNKSLTVENHLLRATAATGSTTLDLPYILGYSFLNKSVESAGVTANTRITAEQVVDVGSSDKPNLVMRVTLNQATINAINVGSTVTLRTTMLATADSTNYSIEVDAVPVGPIIGMRLIGAGIPEDTVVTSVNGRTLTTNNLLVGVTAGTVIGYEIVNQRGGIWRVNISSENLVTLEFVQEVRVGQKIKVQGGYSNGFTFMVYDYNVGVGSTMPAYRRWSTEIQATGKYTVFDGNGTRFFNNRDTYLEPESDDKYLKFPQIGVFE